MPPSSTRIEIPGATPASGSGGRKARLGDATWEGPYWPRSPVSRWTT
jgi:hypothetical protein